MPELWGMILLCLTSVQLFFRYQLAGASNELPEFYDLISPTMTCYFWKGWSWDPRVNCAQPIKKIVISSVSKLRRLDWRSLILSIFFSIQLTLDSACHYKTYSTIIIEQQLLSNLFTNCPENDCFEYEIHIARLYRHFGLNCHLWNQKWIFLNTVTRRIRDVRFGKLDIIVSSYQTLAQCRKPDITSGFR